MSAFQAQQPTEAASSAPDITVSCKRYPHRKYNCIARLASDGSQVTHCWYYKKLTAANREACRQKALNSLGFFKAPTAKAANKVPASYNASLMVCPRNSTGHFYVLSPYMEPRDTSQNGWVGFFDVVYRRTSSGGWLRRYTTQPLYHYKPSDIFEQALQANDMKWMDANGNVSSGDFSYRGLRGDWYEVVTVYLWAAQPSYPYPDNDALLANQDPYGVSTRGQLCQAGVDNYGD